MFVVYGTKKFLDRVHRSTPPAPDPQPATTVLGAWYATVLFWQPQVALFVNEPTRLPLFVLLAPAATVIQRMPQTATAVFTALGLDEEFIAREVTEMGGHQLTKTANRSVLGSMNDFANLAAAHHTPTDTTAKGADTADQPPIGRFGTAQGPSSAQSAIAPASRPRGPASRPLGHRPQVTASWVVDCARHSVWRRGDGWTTQP